MSLCLILLAHTSIAQNQAWDPMNPEHLKETGKLFTVQIIPGKKQATFYVVGTKKAEIKFNKLSVEATLFTNGEEHKIELFRKKDYFESQSPLIGEAIELKVQDENPAHMERLRIKLKNP